MKTISLKIVTAIVGVAILSGVAGNAEGAAVVGLRNTGVDAGGVVLANNTVTDNNYSLTTVPVGAATVPVAKSSAGGFPIPPWLADNALSAWIAPTNLSTGTSDVGLYIYSMSFTVATDLATTLIHGQWASDNEAVMKINGNTVSSSPDFLSWTAFSFGAASGLVSGLNVLTFEVTNNESVTGLRVEISGEDGNIIESAVPEPASLAMWGLGALVMGAARKRRKTVVSE